MARPKTEREPVIDVKTLHAKIGELTMENDLYPVRPTRRICYLAQKTIDPTAKLSVSRQAAVLRISRSSIY